MFKIKIFNRYYDFAYVSSFIEVAGLMILVFALYKSSLMRDFDNAMVIAGTVTMTLVYRKFFSVAESNIKDVLYKKGILEKKEF